MEYTKLILAAAKAAKVSGALLLAICTHETGLRNTLLQKDGHSPTYGICQVKYETAQMVGFHGKPEQLMNPAVNATWAANYLRYQSDRYSDDWCHATAAYNAGRYNESAKMPGYPRNLKYVRRVQRILSTPLKYRLNCGEEEVASK